MPVSKSNTKFVIVLEAHHKISVLKTTMAVDLRLNQNVVEEMCPASRLLAKLPKC